MVLSIRELASSWRGTLIPILGHKTFCLILLSGLLVFSGCSNKSVEGDETVWDDKEAKEKLQGIWVERDSETRFFKIEGDSVRYPDSSSQAAYFRINRDSIIIGSPPVGYAVLGMSEDLLRFINQAGDTISLEKSHEETDSIAFADIEPKILSLNDVEKRDTVVMFGGERYHCYIAVNPTKIRVIRPTFNDEGIMVDKVYYDNIIHISVFKGKERLFSSDIKRDMFSGLVPLEILRQSVLGNIRFSRADSRGFHFDTTICIPDGASCYLLDTFISFDGKMGIDLLEY